MHRSDNPRAGTHRRSHPRPGVEADPSDPELAGRPGGGRFGAVALPLGVITALAATRSTRTAKT